MSQPIHYDFLIIGADAAGLSAAVQIRSHKKEASIGILEKGEIISYGACGLPYAIEGRISDFDALIHFTPESFSGKYRAEIHTSTGATGLDVASKTVLAKKGEEQLSFTYGRLLVATGAHPTRLSAVDYDSPRVFELKTIPDGKRIQEAVKGLGAKKAVIAGAGYIGLEMADVFSNLGLEVTVVDMAERPVPRMAPDLGKAVSKKMEEKGIHFVSEASITFFRDEGSSVVLGTSKGEITGDILLTGLGVSPSTSFLEGSGVALERGALVVDHRGRTSVEDIYGAGDCALVYHRLMKRAVYMPLGSTANKQGRIAGQNMVGVDLEFPGIIGTQIFKFFDLALASTGLTEEQAREMGYEVAVVGATRPGKAGYYPGSGKMEVHLIVDKKTGVILGGHLVAPHDGAAMIDALGVMAQMGMNAADAAYFDAAYAPPFAPVWNALISAAGKFGRS